MPLRGGIAKETEGVTLVSPPPSPPAIPNAPLHLDTNPRILATDTRVEERERSCPRVRSAPGRRLLEERRRYRGQELRGHPDPGRGDPGQDSCYDGLHGAVGRHVELSAPRGELEQRASPVCRVAGPLHETAPLETVEDPRQRARVYPKNSRESAGGDPGPASQDAQRDALRPRESEGSVHLLRERLKAVVERPDEAHEVEYLAKWLPRLGSRPHEERIARLLI